MRDVWVELAEEYYRGGDWANCYQAIGRGLATKPAAPVMENDPRNFGAHPHDLAAVAAWRIGCREQALAHAEQALALAPNDARYARNVERMRRALGSSGGSSEPAPAITTQRRAFGSWRR